MRFAAQTLANTTAQIVGVAGTLAISIVVARVLGPAGRGQIALLVTVPWIVSLPLEAGLGMSGVSAVTTGRLSMQELRGAFTVFLPALVAGALLAQTHPIVWAFAKLLPSLNTLSVRVVLGASFAAAVLTLLRSVQLAAGHLQMFNVLLIIDKLILSVGIVALWAVGHLSEQSMAFAVAGAYGGSAVFAAIASRVPTRSAAKRGLRDLCVLGRVGWRVALANSLQSLNYRLDMVILNLLSTTAALGVYSVAVSVGTLIWYVPNAAGTVLLSRVGAFGRAIGAARTAAVSRVVLMAVLVLCAFALLVGRPLIVALFGKQFASAYPLLLLLMPGLLALSPPKVINSYLVVAGHAGVAVYASGIAVVATVALDLLLIPGWGAAGAAAASSVAYVLFAVAMLVGFHRVTDVKYSALLPTPRDITRLASTLRGRV